MTNDEVTALPPMQFGGRVVVVDSVGAVAAACRDLASHKAIGFDTETRPSFKAGVVNKVALLQLSTPKCCYLFRLCRIPLDKEIIRLLESDKVLKIGADTAGDLRALQALRHFTAGGFIDLQSIASQWGVAEKSVRKLAGIVLGGRVSKAQRLSNWEATSLTRAQQLYAATDAWVCLEIYGKLLSTDRNPLPEPEKPKDAKPKKAAKKRHTPRNKKPAPRPEHGAKEVKKDETPAAKPAKKRWLFGFGKKRKTDA